MIKHCPSHQQQIASEDITLADVGYMHAESGLTRLMGVWVEESQAASMEGRDLHAKIMLNLGVILAPPGELIRNGATHWFG